MFEMVDKRYEGGLEAHLRALRAEGLSIDQIAASLDADGITVTGETVRRWCRRAGVPTHRVPAS